MPRSIPIAAATPAPALRPAALGSIDVGSAWSGTFGTRKLRAEITEQRLVSNPWGSSLEVNGSVYAPDGAEVGDFRRALHEGWDGDRWVQHKVLGLADDYQNTGFAKGFNDHAEAIYPDWGVRRIEVHAVGVGSYTWARHGYGFDPSMPRHKTPLDRARLAAEMVNTARRKGAIDADEMAMLSNRLVGWDARVGARTLRSPGQIANLPGDLGKRILIGREWHGVKQLRNAG